MPELSIDLESRSAVDLRKTGVGVYADDPSTDVWCVCYAVDDGPVQTWFPEHKHAPSEIGLAIYDREPIHAYNASFEKAMWRILADRYGWPTPKPEQWRCTMAAGLAMGLPAGLDAAAAALRLSATKDKAGYALMMRMSRPRSVNGACVWWDDPDRVARLAKYCAQDVELERAVRKRISRLSDSEQQLWLLDQEINERGLYVDFKLCDAAKRVVELTMNRLNADLTQATNGKVPSCSAVEQLTEFVRGCGVEIDSIDKATVTRLLAEDNLPVLARAVLGLRQAAAKTSVAKIDAMVERRQADGRVRHLFQFHGASTGRWAGRGIQPQNLPRPSPDADVDQIISDVLSRNLEGYESPLLAVANCIRGMIAAAPGRKLIAADFAAIESRVIAWLAGEEWKLEAFRNYDAGIGPDMYELAFARAFTIDVDAVSKAQRQVGKTMELAPGFGGGAGAFHKLAQSFGLDVGDWYDELCYHFDMKEVDRAKEAFVSRGKASGMRKESWIAAELLKGRWRGAHPEIVALWSGLETASIFAVKTPDTVVPCGRIRYVQKGNFLFCQLPSGRILSYPWPKLVDKETPWGELRPMLVYEGMDSYTRKWGEHQSYGGLLAENVTQATARDLLADAMKRLDKAGYAVVSHAHDEIVAEVASNFGSVEGFCQIMAGVPEWAKGCPLAAAGWEGERYRK